MCFYDQYIMACGDHKWGHFRQHCSKEYRTGEVCGTKLIMNSHQKPEKCKICQKIDVRRRKLDKEAKRIERWTRELSDGFPRTASIESAMLKVETLIHEVDVLEYDRKLKQRDIVEEHPTTPAKGTIVTNVDASPDPHKIQQWMAIAEEPLKTANAVESDRKQQQDPRQHGPMDLANHPGKSKDLLSVLGFKSDNITFQILGKSYTIGTSDDNPSLATTTRALPHVQPDEPANLSRVLTYGYGDPFAHNDEWKRELLDTIEQPEYKNQKTEETYSQAQEDAENSKDTNEKHNETRPHFSGETTEKYSVGTGDASNDDDNDSISVISQASSVNSVADSLFSKYTTYSTSSVGSNLHNNERLYALLTVDELNKLYDTIYQKSTPRKTEQNLRRLLKVFASCLRREAGNLSEKRTANFVLYRARSVAHIVVAQLGENKDKRSRVVQQHEEKLNISESEEQEDDESEDDVDGPDDDSDDISSLETFILRSYAFADFRTHLEVLVRSQNVEETADIPQTSNDPIAMAQLETTQSAEKHWEETKTIEWTCSCGKSFQEEITEFKRGAADALALSLSSSTDSAIDIEKIAGSQDESSSTSCDDASRSDNSHRRTSADKLPVESGGAKGLKTQILENLDSQEYILLCRKYGTDTKLHHADISNALCDYTSYTVLHKHYYGRFPKLWKMLSLSEISEVEFVRFHLYWSTNVSIDVTDIGELPPMLSSEYSYNADTSPPVPKTALRHFIEHPDHAPKHTARHRPRIPKKIREQLSLHKDLDLREGYGLYIQERLNWMKIFVVEAIAATVCMIFAVAWCIGNKGGIQEGFAIAGTGIAYMTITLGTLQAVSQNWY